MKERQLLEMHRCPILSEQICLGGNDTMAGKGCRRGHQGPMCTTCVEGYQLGADGLCDLCAADDGVNSDIGIGIVSLLVVVAIIVFYGVNHKHEIFVKCKSRKDACCRAGGCKRHKDGEPHSLPALVPGQGNEMPDKPDTPAVEHKVGGSLGLMIKAKILLGLAQVSSQFVLNFDYLEWPTNFRDLQRFFSFLNFDLPNMGCMMKINFIDKYLSAVIMPFLATAPFVIGFIFCGMTAAGQTRYNKFGQVDKHGRYDDKGNINFWRHKQNGCMKAILYLLFLVYPSTCASILRIFHCTELQNGKSYLAVDMSIPCVADAPVSTQLFGDSQTYGAYRTGAGFMLLVYAVGTPSFFFIMLWLKRNELYEDKAKHIPDAEVENELGFLYAGYESDFYWWECVELLRKLALTSLITFVAPGTSSQLFSAVILAQVFIVLYARFQPYESDSDDSLQLCSQLHIWFTALAALVVMMSSVVQDDGQVITDSTYESKLFDVILVSSTLAPIALAFIQCFIRARKNIAHELLMLERAAAGAAKRASASAIDGVHERMHAQHHDDQQVRVKDDKANDTTFIAAGSSITQKIQV